MKNNFEPVKSELHLGLIYLHDKSLQTDSVVVVRVVTVKFEVVVEDQTVLHVTWHFKPYSCST